MSEELEKFDLESYLDKDDTPSEPFLIEPPYVSTKKLIQKLGETRAKKEADWHFRERYVNKNKEFNSMVEISEGLNVHTALINGLIPGKVYTYDYNPKWRDVLEYFDRRPLILSLGHFKAGNTVLEMGINLHFLPPKAVMKIMELTWKVYDLKLRRNIEHLMKEDWNQVPLPLYRNAKKIYDIIGQTNYKFAIRHYLRNRMKDLQIVEYTDWKYIPLLETKWVMGATRKEIWEMYEEDRKERKRKEEEKRRKLMRTDRAEREKREIEKNARKKI